MPRPPASTSPSPPPTLFPYEFTANLDFPHLSTAPSIVPTGSHSSTAGPATVPAHIARRSARPTRRTSLHRLFAPPRENDSFTRRPVTPNLAPNPGRPRATPSERYLRRSQARIREQRSADMDATLDLPDSISDIPIHNPFTLSHVRPRTRSPTVQVSSERRHKRRKLDHNAPMVPEYVCFKYGHKGQVVPGRLRMEIVSCDGGEHLKDNPPGLYKIQNVLRNDKSVYCSESSSCNLLLKHIGEAPFALEKVVIRAPDRGFTAPVQEGLVFVSMSANELLAGTTAYNLQYAPHSPITSPTASSDGDDDDHEQLSLREAIEDPLIWQHSRMNTSEGTEERLENFILRNERLNADSLNSIPSMRSDAERRRVMRQMVEIEEETDGDNCDADESYHGAARVSAPTPPPFTVTTASEEDESESNEEQPSAAVMADRLRRESRWRRDSDFEDDELIPRIRPLRRAPALGHSTYGEWQERRERYIEPIRATPIGLPSRIEAAPDLDHLIPPHARFFIAKNKNKITIKFHPAISGKHVLLKFWSPKRDGNIDIESVQFYGYSGPRFFPAVEPR